MNAIAERTRQIELQRRTGKPHIAFRHGLWFVSHPFEVSGFASPHFFVLKNHWYLAWKSKSS